MKRIVCFVALVITTCALFATLPLSPQKAHASSSFASLPSGHAYAAFATPKVGNILNSGVVQAPAGISCTYASTTSTAHIADLSIGTNTTSGTADSSVTNTQTATSGLIQSTTTIENPSLLGGLVKATEIKAGVQTSANASAITSAVTNATFSNLVINGTALPNNPAPNTVRQLPGLGSVTLNEQSLSNGTRSSTISVNMVDIRVTASGNTFNLPVGAQIVIGHVDTNEMLESLPVLVSAGAYGLYVLNDSQIVNAPLAYTSTGCMGGSSQNSVTNSSLPVVGTVGSAIATTSANMTSSGGVASAQSKISGLNLLAGVIKADSIVTNANATLNGTTGSGSASVTLTNATLAGGPLAQSPAPNTYVVLPGLGYAYLNEQSHIFNSTTAIQGVYALDIHITTGTNVLNLPVGARIIVGAASTNVSVS